MRIKNRFTGELILEIETLSGANLRNANLSNANLRNANLRNVNLSNANLSNANLSNANLSDADLRGANLRGANLRGANLRGADLRGANLPIYCKWSVSHEGESISIGCKTKTIVEWDAWFASSEEYSTPRSSEDFKRIRANYEAVKAYVQCLAT